MKELIMSVLISTRHQDDVLRGSSTKVRYDRGIMIGHQGSQGFKVTLTY